MAKNKEYTNNETHSRGSVKSEYTHTRRGYKDTKSPSIVKDTSTPVRNEILRLEETLQHISYRIDILTSKLSHVLSEQTNTSDAEKNSDPEENMCDLDRDIIKLVQTSIYIVHTIDDLIDRVRV